MAGDVVQGEHQPVWSCHQLVLLLLPPPLLPCTCLPACSGPPVATCTDHGRAQHRATQAPVQQELSSRSPLNLHVNSVPHSGSTHAGPMGMQLVTERDDSEFARLSQLVRGARPRGSTRVSAGKVLVACSAVPPSPCCQGCQHCRTVLCLSASNGLRQRASTDCTICQRIEPPCGC